MYKVQTDKRREKTANPIAEDSQIMNTFPFGKNQHKTWRPTPTSLCYRIKRMKSNYLFLFTKRESYKPRGSVTGPARYKRASLVLELWRRVFGIRRESNAGESEGLMQYMHNAEISCKAGEMCRKHLKALLSIHVHKRGRGAAIFIKVQKNVILRKNRKWSKVD